MTAGSIARRYAKALYEIGEQEGNLITILNQVQTLAGIWQESADLRDAMSDPRVGIQARRDIWADIASRAGVAATGRNFLNLLIDKSRLTEMPAIARELGLMADIKQNRLRAEVVSAAPMGDAEANQLKSSLERLTGKVVVLKTRTDPELIGGAVTRVGDTFFDGSIKRQLEKLKETMLGRG